MARDVRRGRFLFFVLLVVVAACSWRAFAVPPEGDVGKPGVGRHLPLPGMMHENEIMKLNDNVRMEVMQPGQDMEMQLGGMAAGRVVNPGPGDVGEMEAMGGMGSGNQETTGVAMTNGMSTLALGSGNKNKPIAKTLGRMVIVNLQNILLYAHEQKASFDVVTGLGVHAVMKSNAFMMEARGA
ncbi:unnamed protein product [Symbiodinium sp. CCMP2456]|nr:unnamed protein product [Symbiodinium sp. CCMP2456]